MAMSLGSKLGQTAHQAPLAQSSFLLADPTQPGTAWPCPALWQSLIFIIFPHFADSMRRGTAGLRLSAVPRLFYEYEWLSTRLLSHQLRWLVAFQFLVLSAVAPCRSYWSFYFHRFFFFLFYFFFVSLLLYFVNYWVLDRRDRRVDSVPLVVMTSQFHFAQLWYLAYYLRCHCFRKYLTNTNTRKDGCTDWQIDR